MVVLFTFHAYGTWLPDRMEGSYHWKRGYQPQNIKLGHEYATKQKEVTARFGAVEHRVIIGAILAASAFQDLRLHFATVDDTHIHILASWRGRRDERLVQQRLKYSITRQLNQQCARRTWLSKDGHRRYVNNELHFDQLRDEYLPSHMGLSWDERRQSRDPDN